MKRILKSLIISALIVIFLGTVIQAKEIKNFKVVSTKQNTWYVPKTFTYSHNGNDIISTFYRYKINVPANYYITLSLKKTNGGIYIYNSLTTNWEKYFMGYDSYSGKKTFNIVLPKGIYYFGNYGYSSNSVGAFKYKFTKYVNKANYKASKALAWNAGKKVTIVQSPGHNYERWYKVRLTKKKRITVYGAENIELYDAKHQYVEMTGNEYSDGTVFSSYDKLKAGTYYIRIFGARPYYGNPWYGSVQIVWWK